MKNTIDIAPKDLEITRNILTKNLPINTTIWVFGSRAKGTARKFSDLDLLIDTNHQPLHLETMTSLMDDFEESDLPYKVDIVDWNTISDSFRQIIDKEKKFLIHK